MSSAGNHIVQAIERAAPIAIKAGMGSQRTRAAAESIDTLRPCAATDRTAGGNQGALNGLGAGASSGGILVGRQDVDVARRDRDADDIARRGGERDRRLAPQDEILARSRRHYLELVAVPGEATRPDGAG